MTMGALLRFKKETGYDIASAKAGDTSDMITLLWCCVASACMAEKVAFDMTLLDFADLCSVEVLTEFNESFKEKQDGAKKK